MKNEITYSFLLAFALTFFSMADDAVGQTWPFRNFPNSNRPDATALFMANGIYDAADPNYQPPTADDFDRIIMGRDEEAIEDRRQEAADYFLERFGVDFSESDFAQGGAIGLFHVYSDPRWNYRCYKLPGRNVPRTGLIVHDAQYVMAVLAPQATLFGSWGGASGTVVDAGTVAVDGEYLIQGTNRFRCGNPRNVHLTFRSVTPIFDASSGNIKFDCRLDSEQFGAGAALGRQETYVLNNGMTQIAINNVLQFPAPLWSFEQ
ncbi:MAG: hypothetical protein AAF456_20330 [Planctomycetota bacterium]